MRLEITKDLVVFQVLYADINIIKTINGRVIMAKGFMIFLEGGASPKKVHAKVEGAYREIYRLSKLYPRNTVTLYHVVKRVRDGVSIGSHIPEGVSGICDASELVTHEKVPGWKSRKKKSTTA